MVRHIVLFNLAEGDPRPKRERIAEIRDKARELGLQNIPGVRLFELLENFKEGGHDFVIYAEMDSPEAVEVYQPHPDHEAFKAFIKGKVCDRSSADAVAGE